MRTLPPPTIWLEYVQTRTRGILREFHPYLYFWIPENHNMRNFLWRAFFSVNWDILMICHRVKSNRSFGYRKICSFWYTTLVPVVSKQFPVRWEDLVSGMFALWCANLISAISCGDANIRCYSDLRRRGFKAMPVSLGVVRTIAREWRFMSSGCVGGITMDRNWKDGFVFQQAAVVWFHLHGST